MFLAFRQARASTEVELKRRCWGNSEMHREALMMPTFSSFSSASGESGLPESRAQQILSATMFNRV